VTEMAVKSKGCGVGKRSRLTKLIRLGRSEGLTRDSGEAVTPRLGAVSGPVLRRAESSTDKTGGEGPVWAVYVKGSLLPWRGR
jgi:hypothetical protein